MELKKPHHMVQLAADEQPQQPHQQLDSSSSGDLQLWRDARSSLLKGVAVLALAGAGFGAFVWSMPPMQVCCTQGPRKPGWCVGRKVLQHT